MNKVYQVEVTLSAIIQSKPIKRKSVAIVGAPSPDNITLEALNEPYVLHRAIPRFITGKLREIYRITDFRKDNIKQIGS